MTENTSRHTDQLARLGRVAGQVGGIQRMIQEGRNCMDILIQLRAARAALKRVEANVLERHILHCAEQAMTDPTQTAQRIEELRRYFEASKD